MELTGEAGKAYRPSPAEMVDLGLGKVPETAEEFNAKWRESEGGKAIEQASEGYRIFLSSFTVSCFSTKQKKLVRRFSFLL